MSETNKTSSSSHKASAGDSVDNDAKILAQIQRNEIRIKELERQRTGHEFEIKLKSDKLDELCREEVTKTAELAKSREIETNLQAALTAARQSAHTVRSMAECQMSMMPQFRAQLTQIDQQQANRRSEILAKHVRTYEHQLTAYDSREDVTALRTLKTQLAAAQTAFDGLSQQLAQHQAAQRLQHTAHSKALHERIVRMAGDALQQRDMATHIATMSARHRQVREHIEQRQQLLQCYERRRHDLQTRLALLKKQQAKAFLDDIESCPERVEVLMRPLVAAVAVDTTIPSKAAAAEAAAATAVVSIVSTMVSTTTTAITATTTPATATEDDPDCLENSLDQLSISQQMRRVRFNPTDSVRAIAANGDGSESEASSAVGRNDPTDAAGVDGDEEGASFRADTETEEQDVLNSNDSFMCALAANENVLMDVDGVVTTAAASSAVTNTVSTAANESNQLNLSMGDDGFLGEGFDLFDNDGCGAVDGEQTSIDGVGDAPPAKRPKMMRGGSSKKGVAASSAAANNLNTSFGSIAQTSELDFEFIGFEDMGDEANAANVSSRANSLFNFELEEDDGPEYNCEGDLF